MNVNDTPDDAAPTNTSAPAASWRSTVWLAMSVEVSPESPWSRVTSWPSTPPAALMSLTASWAPANSGGPRKARLPVSGSTVAKFSVPSDSPVQVGAASTVPSAAPPLRTFLGRCLVGSFGSLVGGCLVGSFGSLDEPPSFGSLRAFRSLGPRGFGASGLGVIVVAAASCGHEREADRQRRDASYAWYVAWCVSPPLGERDGIAPVGEVRTT